MSWSERSAVVPFRSVLAVAFLSACWAAGLAGQASPDGVAAAPGAHDGLPFQSSEVLSRSRVGEEDRLLALSTLWSEARRSFAYFDRIEEDWDSLYRAFLPRVRSAPSDYAYYLELMRFYAHLRDGHSGVFWPRELDQALGYPPFEVRKVEGRAVVFRLFEESDEMLRAGIRPGLAILEVDGEPVERVVERWRALKTGSTPQATDRLAYFRILTGPRNSAVELLVEEPDGGARTVRLTRSEAYFNDTNLAPERLFASRPPEGGVGYFRADQMHADVADAFDAYVEGAGEMDGLVLDLRYNGGGSDRVSFRMVSRLIDEALPGPVYEVTTYRADRRAFRQPQEAVRAAAADVEPAAGRRFTGPLVVLIGEQTHSATESGFLAVVRNRPRTTFVGRPTAGSTGQPMIFRLPGGAVGAVVSRRTLTPDGRAFVGSGFAPDVPAALSREDLWRGRDRVLERGMAEARARGG